MGGKKDVLTRTPRDWRIVDSDSCSVVWQSSELGIQSPQLTHCAILPLARMQDGQVIVEIEEASHDAVEEKQSDADPDPMLYLGGDVQIDKADKDGERNDMLDNKEFIAPTTNRSHGADGDPNQDSPGDNTMLCDRIGSDFGANVVVGSPVCEPVAHVNGCCKKEASRSPAMKPIDALI